MKNITKITHLPDASALKTRKRYRINIKCKIFISMKRFEASEPQ